MRYLHVMVYGVAAITVGSMGTNALAQSYPNKPIRFIVPFPPGGGTDTVARVISQKLVESWGQQMVIDNRGGAEGIIGTEIAAKAAPDGYTILMGAASLFTVNPSLYSKLPYDPVKDFTPVTLVASTPYIMVVHSAAPVKSIKELIALAKSKPGQLNYASASSITTLTVELFKTMAGVDIVQIPYKGAGPALTALLGKQVEIYYATAPTLMPHVRAGNLRALAITSAKRSSAIPDVPTIAESGLLDFDVRSWFGVLAPTGTSKEIITRLHIEIIKILRMSDMKEHLSRQGADPVGNTPEQFAAIIKEEIAKWAKVVKDSRVRVDHRR